VKIFVSGSLAFDIILDYAGRFADHIKPGKVHVLSLSFLVGSVKKSIGGTAGNIACNLAMLGLKPQILGAVGEDGGEILEKLGRLGVYVKAVKISHQPTAAAYILTDSTDNQIAGFYSGAMMEKVKLPKIKPQDWAIIAAENPRNMVTLAKHYQKNKVRYIFDPGQQSIVLSAKDLKFCIRGANIVIGNDYEIDYIATKIGLPQKQRSLKMWQSVVARTLGAKGSEIIYPNGKKIKIAAAKARRAVDPTGAGDAYRAGFICGLVKGFDLQQAAQLGATVASFAVEQHGTQNHRFNYDIIRSRYNKNFNNKI